MVVWMILPFPVIPQYSMHTANYAHTKKWVCSLLSLCNISVNPDRSEPTVAHCCAVKKMNHPAHYSNVNYRYVRVNSSYFMHVPDPVGRLNKVHHQYRNASKQKQIYPPLCKFRYIHFVIAPARRSQNRPSRHRHHPSALGVKRTTPRIHVTSRKRTVATVARKDTLPVSAEAVYLAQSS